MMRGKNTDRLLITATVALLVDTAIFVAYSQAFITVFGFVTAHLGLVWVLAIKSNAVDGDRELSRRQKMHLLLTTILGPIGPFLTIVWLGLVWLQTKIAIRMFGAEPIFETIAASNTEIAAYRQNEKHRTNQLKIMDDLTFGDRRQKATALRSLSLHDVPILDVQLQIHLHSSDATLSALAAAARENIARRPADRGNEGGTRSFTTELLSAEQKQERARQSLKAHSDKLRLSNTGDTTKDSDQELELKSLLECLFSLGEFEALRYFLGKNATSKGSTQDTGLSKLKAFWLA